ncbi:hypothetical protein [Streptomyces sp. NPDC015130]|uniref:hypothetical protein n=1 Tax=Streptomyces sp. NPDC015130 TaxID=3364940 RepID=UPI0036F98D22
MSALRVNRLVMMLVGGTALSGGGWIVWHGPAARSILPWSPPAVPFERLREYGPSGAAVLLSLVAVLALSLLWGIGQLPSGRSARCVLAVQGLRVRRRTLARAIATDVRALPGVRSARVVLRGRGEGLRATVRLRLAGSAPPGDVVQQVVDGPVRRARAALGIRLGTDIRVTGHEGRPRAAVSTHERRSL